jgi:type VI secretion system secreted protein Hcp
VKINGVKGGDSGQDDALTIGAYSWNLNVPVSTGGGGGGGAGKANFSEFQIQKKVDAASPVLMRMSATGLHITGVDVALYKGGANPAPYVTYRLDNVLISLIQTNSGDETIGFNFTKITQSYHTTKPDGSAGPVVTSCFDLSANKTC